MGEEQDSGVRIQESGVRGVAQVPPRRAGDLRLFKGRSRKGRFQVSGSRCQGLNEGSGFRIRD